MMWLSMENNELPEVKYSSTMIGKQANRDVSLSIQIAEMAVCCL